MRSTKPLVRNGWWFVRGFNMQYGLRVTRGRVDAAGEQGRWALGQRWSRVRRLLHERGNKVEYGGDLDPPW